MADANRHAPSSKRGDTSASSVTQASITQARITQAQEDDRIAADGRRRRRRAQSWGLAAETWAALWLRLKGYRVLARRERTPAGEIDLVVRRGDVLVAVEVKARRSLAAAVDAVSTRQRLRIARALALVAGRDPTLSGLGRRLDLVIVRPWRLPIHLVDVHRDNR
ncbi:YraN family protein [Thalassobaculum salexigens]|uniref:YraN family protein n=1 Tax=Thalassobaculum salexigens TaxID=455360 RepID=UPI003CCB8EDF